MLFDSTCQVVRPWTRKAPLDHALTVDVVVELHERAMRFSDEGLKELRRSDSRPRSLGSKYEAESVQQPNLEPTGQAGATKSEIAACAYMPDQR